MEAGTNTIRKVWVAAGISVDTEINLQIEELTQKFQTAIRNAGENLDFIRKLCNGDLLPLPIFLLGHRDRSPRSRTRWGAGEQHWNSFWYTAMAEKLYQQRERNTRFLFLHKRLIQGVSRGKPDWNAGFTHSSFRESWFRFSPMAMK